MAMQSQHITGFVAGIGAAAVGFYLYKKNQPEVDAFLRKHGIELPSGGGLDAENLSLEQLVAEKERLEDLIAEREFAAEQAPEPADAPPAKPKAKAKRTRKKTTKRAKKS